MAASNIQKSYHLIGGIEADLKDFEFTLEPWYKYFGQIITINRYKLLASDPDFTIESGKAYGLDITCKYAKGRKYFWGVYSYGYVDRYDGKQTYPTPFDRRHNVNLLASYTAGKKSDWEFSIRFNYGSAFPFTQTQAFIEKMDFGTSGISTNYLTQNGTMEIVYADKINGGRLSAYHRLDLSVKRNSRQAKIVFLKPLEVSVMPTTERTYFTSTVSLTSAKINCRYFRAWVFPGHSSH
ncbi:hypothetical protein EMGBS15_04430 [Filimonas sp.]|nr:hypothetical protein EMGBS15_04430 [Filimonas sp.]